MKLKSLYIYVLQFILIYLQLIQIRMMTAMQINNLVILAVLLINVVYLLIREYFEKSRFSFLLIISNLLIVGTGFYLCRETLIQYVNIIFHCFQSGNSNELKHIFDISWNQMDYLVLILFSVYGFLKLIHGLLRSGYFIYPLGVISAGVLILSLISGRANSIILILMILLNIALLVLFNVQNPLELFKKKVFVPVVCVVLSASIMSALLNPFLGSSSSNLITLAFKGFFAAVEAISEILEQDTPEVLEDLEGMMFAGVANLGPLSFELTESLPEDVEVAEDGVPSEGDFEGMEGDLSSAVDSQMSESLEGEDRNPLGNTGRQCKSCSGSTGSNSELCKECEASLKQSSVTPGIGNGQLTNAPVYMPDSSVVLIVESDVPISHLKAFSGGRYDDRKFAFSTETSQGVEKAIRSINQILPYGSSFQQLFYRKVTDHTATITNVAAKKVAYVPYGLVDFDKSVSLVGDNYFDMYFPADYNHYTVYFSTEPIFKNDMEEAVELYQRAVYEEYLQIPDAMKAPLQSFLSSKGIDYTSADKASLIVQIKQMLQSEYTYSLEPGELPEDSELILYFLTQNKKGYCIHFASAATMLYRTCGIPARYVSGYSVPSGFDGVYQVMNTNAHAWTEVFQADRGWIGIEVTAASTGGSDQSDSISESEVADYQSPEDQKIQEMIQNHTSSVEESSSQSEQNQGESGGQGDDGGSNESGSNDDSCECSGTLDGDVQEGGNSSDSSENDEQPDTSLSDNQDTTGTSSESLNDKEQSDKGSSSSSNKNDNDNKSDSSKNEGQPDKDSNSSDNKNENDDSNSSDKDDTNDNNDDEKNPEETPEPSSEPDVEPELMEESDFNLDLQDIGKLIILMLLGICGLSVVVTGVLLYLRKRKREALPIEDIIYMNYDLLCKYSFVTEEIYAMMLRVRFSQYPASEDDLNVLVQRKEELIQHIIKTKKLHKRLVIYLFDGLPVLFNKK